MKTQVWLVFTQSGAVRATKKRPTVGVAERAMLLSVAIPDAAFQRPPVLTASVDVPLEGVVGPTATVTVEPAPVETPAPALAPRDTDEPPACEKCWACLEGAPCAFPIMAGG